MFSVKFTCEIIFKNYEFKGAVTISRATPALRLTVALWIVAACELVSCLVLPDLKRTTNVEFIIVLAIIYERLLAALDQKKIKELILLYDT